MSKWEKVKLGDVCENKISIVDSKTNNPIDYVDISSINNDTKVIESYKVYMSKEAPSRAKQLVQVGDILVSTVRPNLNAVALVKQVYENILVASTGFCILRIKEKITHNYLFHYCKSKKFIDGLMMVARGASYPAVSSSDVKNLVIPLPSLEVQKQIAQNLDTVSELLALQKKKLEELDELIKSVFYDMFGDPVTNEKGWEVSSLQDKIYIKHGFAFEGEYFSNSGYFVLLTPGNFFEKGGYRDRGEKQKYYLSDPQKEYILRKDDLLIAMTEQAPGLLGSPLFVPESNKFLHNQRLGLVEIKGNDLNKKYLFYLFNNFNIRNIIHLTATGIKVRHTSPTKIGEIVVAIPHLSLQNQFASIVTKIEEQKSLVKQSIEETQQLFDSLMSQYFD